MSEEKRESHPLCLALAEAIREASRDGHLVDRDTLTERLRIQGLLCDEPPEAPDMELLLLETLAAHEDLAVFESTSGRALYHVPSLLSRTYASILDRKTSPVLLIAEEVRRNSMEYPRPIPLELFEQSPFDLVPEQIQAALKAMAADPELADITFTTTSTGAVYLFSSRYLERPYAAFLAERADTGLALNP